MLKLQKDLAIRAVVGRAKPFGSILKRNRATSIKCKRLSWRPLSPRRQRGLVVRLFGGRGWPLWVAYGAARAGGARRGLHARDDVGYAARLRYLVVCARR